MPQDYKGTKIPAYSDTADGPQAFKTFVDNGGAISRVTSANRPGSPYEGQVIYNLTDHRHEFWTGTAWVTGVSEPAGTLKMWAGVAGAVPSGYLLCDGAQYAAATYPTLYAVIGANYGAASAGQFRVPNLKGSVPVGYDPAQTEFNALGKTGGAKTHTLAAGELPSHTHTVGAAGAHSHTPPSGGGFVVTGGGGASAEFALAGSAPTKSTAGTTAAVGDHAHSVTGGGGDGAHNNLQPFVAVNYIIKF